MAAARFLGCWFLICLQTEIKELVFCNTNPDYRFEINIANCNYGHARFVEGFGESGYAEQQCSPVQIGKNWYKLFLSRTNGVPWLR